MADHLASIRDSIFLVSYGGGHAAALAPVATELRRRGLPVTILGLTTAASYYERYGLEALRIADLAPLVPAYADAAQRGVRLAEGQPSHPAIPLAETQAYLGVGYTALERMFGSNEAEKRYARGGRKSFCPTEFFSHLFELAPPAVLVSTNSPRFEQAAFAAAAAGRIASLCLVDLFAAFEIEWCGRDGYADKICVLNNAVAEGFRRNGMSRDDVVVTGNPAFDRLSQVDVTGLRQSNRDALNLRANDRLLVWISQPEPAVHPFSGIEGDTGLPIRVERELAAEFARDSRTHLIMRLHPSENRLPAVEGPRVRYGSVDEPLDALLCAADCVLTGSSTVGLEAAMLGLPVVQLMQSIFSADLPLAAMGYASQAGTVDEAVDQIRQAFDAGWTANRALFGLDAARRVADEIAQLMAKTTCGKDLKEHPDD